MAKCRATRVLNMKLIRAQRSALRATQHASGGDSTYKHFSDSDSDSCEWDDDVDYNAEDEAAHQRLEDNFRDDSLANEIPCVVKAMANLPPLDFATTGPIPKKVSYIELPSLKALA